MRVGSTRGASAKTATASVGLVRSSGDSLPRVTTWDYTTTVITHGLLGRKEEELDRGELEATMNELGADGWELATVFLDVALHRERDGHVMVFKRRHDS